MTIQRVSTLGLHQQTLQDVMRVQTNLADLQTQISSGKKTSTFQGLQGQVETFVQLEGKMNKTKTFIQNNELIISRMKTSEVALEQIVNAAEDYKNLLVSRRNGATGQDVPFQLSARGILETIAGQLNTQQEGRYLFSGSRTNVPPVITPVPGAIVAGVPDDEYYQGNNDNLVVQVQETYSMTYNTRANDPALQKLFAAINLGLQGDSTNSQTVLAQASELAAEALDEVIALRANTQQNMINLEQVNERHQQLNTYWKGLSESIINTDLVAASTQVAVDQAILQASFQSFANLSQLKLSDYLR